MGVFRRKDSPVWWLYLETTALKERTDIRVGVTAAQRRDSRNLADDRYHQRMNELAARLYKLPSAQPAIRFDKYATLYEAVIAQHRGARRERELLKPLRAFFGDDLLTAIDPERVRAYMLSRKVAPRTVNREVGLLKAMLRDAVPKYLPSSPIVGLKRLREPTPMRRLLTKDEEQRLLKVCDAQDRALLVLGLDGLLRLGDLLDLEFADRRGVWLSVKDPKGGLPYQVALSPRAVDALDALDSSRRYIFEKFRRAENPRDWVSSARQRLQLLCERAKPKIPYGRKQGGITFHWATRRTGATRMLIEQAVPLPVVQKQGDWKHPETLLAIYAEAGQADQLKAVGQFPQRSRKRGKQA